MTDRDDYPDSPYRGRADRQGGYDYDPLSDPLPAQPPPRGRRARPEPGQNAWNEPPGHDPMGPPSGRRRRAEPPEVDEQPPRRFGAADALRGSRAARGGQRPRGAPTDTGSHQAPGADPTQEALAALAGLGGSSETPGRPRPEEPPAEPPRRARRTRADEAPEARSPLWGDDEDEPTPAFFAEDPDEEPKGRRARRRRETSAFEAVPDEQPPGRRGRRRARRGADEEPGDTGSFPATGGSRSDTGSFAAGPDSGAFAEPEPEPGTRRGRRRRSAEPSSGAFPLPDLPDDPRDQDEPRASTGSFPVQEKTAATGAFPLPEEEEPKRRRGRRRGRRAEPEPEPVEQEFDEDPVQDDYEEDSLEDIAASYGDGRATRKRLKAAKKAQAKRRESAKGGGGRPPRRKRKGPTILLALVLMLVIAGGGFAVMRTYVFPSDFEGTGSGEVVITVEDGQSGGSVAQALVDQGVVASSRAFTNALGESGEALAPGTYALAEGMSGEAAVAALFDPDSRLGGRVTIREGLRGDQILDELAASTGASKEELEEAYAQTDELGLPDYASEGPAGYLYPATYRFEPDTDALSMLRTMVTQHRQVTEGLDLEGRAEGLGYDANEMMAIASIVQAESGSAEDMPKISRVVHNRLDIDMPLQMDSTCFYAIGDYGIALNNDQLSACEADDSGFDTYHRTGLVPGPFVAPGEDAIEAALEPEEGEWLYFVATDPENGVTEFAETHEEFELLKEAFEETWGGGGS
ncbi:endolytic transglycosylase MltG [Nocardiopsis sp. JB363]|uniref:endolytic transglycosylase MltG n=1 Tax=Nocardiopsis sp. JB363 TaxID=1434837 RepID=UPI00097AECE4|nr:endolytic transglycosylase MltG [Nocardiopsis sp. JB363]SIO86258.1 protein YceG like [Nocardiopsis sp. JB363]